MLGLLLRRVVYLGPTLLFLSIGVFALSLGLGSDRAAEARAGNSEVIPNEVALANAKKALHLDRPVVVRYVEWLGAVAHFDFGQSFTKLETVNGPDGPTLRGQPVAEAVGTVFPRTLSLALFALVFASVFGGLAGVIGGMRPGSVFDRTSMVFSTLGLALPSFWVGMLLVGWIAVSTRLLPAVGYAEIGYGGLWEWARHLIIPGIALGAAPAAVIARQTRGSLAEVMSSSYIRTAWAKGSSLRHVVLRHALRNAATAPLTVYGLLIIQLLGGTVVIETLFGINGIGQLIVGAVRSNDVPMLQGCIMLLAVMTIAVNFVVDVGYGVLNPKVRSA
jgi:peptide/nickel transport system permease protein